MRKLSNLFIVLISPVCLFSQITTFQSSENMLFSKNILDVPNKINTDTIKQISIGPRIFGVSSVSDGRAYYSYMLGADLSANLGNKFVISANYDKLEGDHNSLIANYFDSLGVYTAFGAKNKRYEFNINYTFRHFFDLDLGKGNFFIGNGYRSLLLSSEHASYPYLKLTTQFGPIRYYNLFTTFLNPKMNDYGRKKHASIHFLDFQLTSNINVGVFEGVLWQAKDENYNRGYDFEYLNPIIFFRPVEFSKRSPDNVLMGATLNARFQKTAFYSQILLDDLNISRQKDRDEEYSGGFFQNKFAYQLGVKSSFKGIDALLEYNQSQPYTYAHKEPIQSYTHMSQALAHPLGANFKEVVMLINYSKEKWHYNLKLTVAKAGLDSVDTHYGQNIFASDFDAQGNGEEYSYGNFNGQGVSTQIHTIHVEVAYSLRWFDVFGSVYYRAKQSDLVDQNSLWYSVGFRTFPFLTLRDY